MCRSVNCRWQLHYRMRAVIILKALIDNFGDMETLMGKKNPAELITICHGTNTVLMGYRVLSKYLEGLLHGSHCQN